MSDHKKVTQQSLQEMAKCLNVHLTGEQIAATENLINLGVSPMKLVRFIQEVRPVTTQTSPSNRENAPL